MSDQYLKELSKEQLLVLFKRMLVYTNKWAYQLEKRLEELEEKEVFLATQAKLYTELGAREGAGLKKMGLADGEGVEAIASALRHSHWAALENMVLEIVDDDKLRFGVKNCSTIHAMGEEQKITCLSLGRHLRQGFVQGVDERASVSLLDDSDNFSCLWEVTLA